MKNIIYILLHILYTFNYIYYKYYIYYIILIIFCSRLLWDGLPVNVVRSLSSEDRSPRGSSQLSSALVWPTGYKPAEPARSSFYCPVKTFFRFLGVSKLSFWLLKQQTPSSFNLQFVCEYLRDRRPGIFFYAFSPRLTDVETSSVSLICK